MTWQRLFQNPLTHITGAGVLLCSSSSGRVLLLQKPGGYWETPGGHLEPGESPLQAALRELYEETGLGGSIEIEGYRDTTRDYRLYLGAIDREFGPRLSNEHVDAVWAASGSLPSPLHPGLRGVL